MQHDSVTREGFTGQVMYDEDACDPRRDFDHLGTMYCWHPRYELGDKQMRVEHVREVGLKAALEEEGIDLELDIVLPLFLYDHSGITMSTSSARFRAADSMAWDWGQVGVIVVTREEVRREYSVERISKKLRAMVIDLLVAEVKEYDDYLTGQVFGVVINDPDGMCVESVWGIYGVEYAEEERDTLLDYSIKQARTEHFARVKAWIRNRVPLIYRTPMIGGAL